MLAKLKHLFESKPRIEFQDAAVGNLVSRHSGVWCADIPFQGRSVSLLIPGSDQQPDTRRLAHARKTIQALSALVRDAKEFAIQKQAQLSGERLVFEALNYFYGTKPTDFGLDFTEVGDNSGNCWQVHFSSGQPRELDYT
jgi:hypothetical protein